jgi:hypothetical protein
VFNQTNIGDLEPRRFVLRGPDGSEADISELREGFRQGFVLEMLDLERGRTVPNGVFVFPLNPTTYRLTEPFQKTLTPGSDDTVTREENGIIVRRIELEGTFGLNERRARGFQGAQGSGGPLTGTQHFEELRNFFRRYSAFKKEPKTSARVVMIFHALRSDDHFVVVPESLVTPRDAKRNRVHYEYKISLDAVDEATRSGLTASVNQPEQFTRPLGDVAAAFNEARASVAELTADLGTLRRRVQNIDAVIIQAGQVLNAVGAFLSGGARLVSTPISSVALLAEVVGQNFEQLVRDVDPTDDGAPLRELARAGFRLEAMLNRILVYDEIFQNFEEGLETLFEGERALSQDEILAGRGQAVGGGDDTAGASAGSGVRARAGTVAEEAGLAIPRNTALIEREITRTDSLESIATEAGTAPEAIIVLNDLRPPYFAPAGGPGVLGPGDVIVIPGPDARNQGGRATGRGAQDYLEADEAVYGVDIGIVDSGGKFDIGIDAAGGLDCTLARGVQNIVQGTEITVNTERGQTVFAPDVGIRRNVGVKGTAQHALLASIVLREAILLDSRVAAIQSSRVVLEGDTLQQEITPVLINQRQSVQFVLPFGRASSSS